MKKPITILQGNRLASPRPKQSIFMPENPYRSGTNLLFLDHPNLVITTGTTTERQKPKLLYPLPTEYVVPQEWAHRCVRAGQSSNTESVRYCFETRRFF